MKISGHYVLKFNLMPSRLLNLVQELCLSFIILLLYSFYLFNDRTQKAVLTLLKDLSSEITEQKSDRKSKKRTIFAVSDIIMKQCRIILRKATATDDGRVFCNLLGRKLMNTTEKYEEGILGSPALVSRPLDFRTIDLRLAVGTYSGSHEAFLEDVREVCAI